MQTSNQMRCTLSLLNIVCLYQLSTTHNLIECSLQFSIEFVLECKTLYDQMGLTMHALCVFIYEKATIFNYLNLILTVPFKFSSFSNQSKRSEISDYILLEHFYQNILLSELHVVLMYNYMICVLIGKRIEKLDFLLLCCKL